MNNLFLTGKVRVGKTTLLKKLLHRLSKTVGGFSVQRRHNHCHDCLEFTMKELAGPLSYKMAEVYTRSGQKNISVHRDAFDLGAVSILEKNLNKDILVLDELGFMERDAFLFQRKVFQLLDSQKTVFGILKDHDCPFLNRIRQRQDIHLIHVTEQNRDHLLDQLYTIYQSFH